MRLSKCFRRFFGESSEIWPKFGRLSRPRLFPSSFAVLKFHFASSIEALSVLFPSGQSHLFCCTYLLAPKRGKFPPFLLFSTNSIKWTLKPSKNKPLNDRIPEPSDYIRKYSSFWLFLIVVFSTVSSLKLQMKLISSNGFWRNLRPFPKRISIGDLFDLTYRRR